MRTLLLVPSCALLVACGSDPSSVSDIPGSATDSTAANMGASWPGYYDGTLPCAECPGMVTQLWVRSDSTFVLRRRCIDRDSVAFGTIGGWLVSNGTLELYDGMHVVRQLALNEIGLEWLDEDGIPIGSTQDHILEKLADELQDEILRMRLSGTFTYMADAKSFQPCGSRFTWPCAGGMDRGPEEGDLLNSMTGAELERAYHKAVRQSGDPWTIEVECSLSMGPSMEGDGADEYIFIHRVIEEGATCP